MSTYSYIIILLWVSISWKLSNWLANRLLNSLHGYLGTVLSYLAVVTFFRYISNYLDQWNISPPPCARSGPNHHLNISPPPPIINITNKKPRQEWPKII